MAGLPQIGEYQLLGEVARGAMGIVYQGQAPDGTTVALKVLHSRLATAPERFEREARLLRELGDAGGFVPLIETGTSPLGRYIVMPFLRAGSLRHRLRQGPLEGAETLALGRALGEALARAHAQGIVHRDLKPENILFDDDGHPLIADLGLGKHFQREGPGAGLSRTLTQEGRLVGTAGYMPAAQVRNPKDVGPEADVFAVGAILYECLAGRPAFSGANLIEVLARLASGTFEPLEDVRPDTPPALLRAVNRCLGRDDRPHPADGAALVALLDEPEAPTPRRSFSRGVAAVSVVLVVGGALALAVRAQADRASARTETPSANATPAPSAEPARTFPPHCAGFLSSKRARLSAAWGSWAWRAPAPLRAVAATPDGTSALTAGGDGLRRWDLERGVSVWVVPRAKTGPIALSRDGKLLLCGGRTLTLHDANSGAEVARLEAHTAEVTAVALSPDGKRALTGAADGALRLWDIASRRSRRLGGKTPVVAVEFSADGRHALTAAGRSLRVWDLLNGDIAGGATSQLALTAACFLGADRFVAGHHDGSVTIWKLGRGRRATLRATLRAHRGPVLSLDSSAEKNRLLTGGTDGLLKLWSVSDGKTIQSFEGHSNAITARFAAKGRLAISVARDCSLRVWDLTSGKRRGQGAPQHLSPITCLAPSADGSQLASGGRNGQVLELNTSDGQARQLAPGAGARVLALARRDGAVLVADARGRVRRLGRGGRLLSPPGADKGFSAFAFGPQAETAVFAEGRVLSRLTLADRKALALDAIAEQVRATRGEVREGRANRKIPHGWRRGEVVTLSISPDGKRALVGKNNLRLLFCDLQKQELLWDLPDGVRGETYHAIALDPRGQVAFTASSMGLKVWSLITDAEEALAMGSDRGSYRAVAFSPKGRLAVASSKLGGVELWDVAGLARVDRLDISPDVATAIVFTDTATFYVGTRAGWTYRFRVLAD